MGERSRSGQKKKQFDGVARYPTGDCEEQEIAIGKFLFAAVDFGDTIRVSDEIQRGAQNVENREPNQFVSIQLAA